MSKELQRLRNVAQTAVLIREGIMSSPHDAYEIIYDAIKDEVGGFPGVAQFFGDAAIVHEANIPDKGESFDYLASCEEYAGLLYYFIESQGYCPKDHDMKDMVAMSVLNNRFEKMDLLTVSNFDEMIETLEHAEHALNEIPNTPLTGVHKDSYEVAAIVADQIKKAKGK